MSIEKHGKKWRVRQIIDGHLYMVSVDHKPTKAEAIQLMSKALKQGSAPKASTFESVALEYVAAKDKILSPSTKRGYQNILRNLPETFRTAPVNSITAMTVQKLVNDLSDGRSAKTVSNYAAYIMAVLKSADIDIKAPQLPQRQRKMPYIPTADDMRIIFGAIAGTKYEVPLTLAALGLRRSEILALTPADLDGCVLHINKALVPNEHGEMVLKGTKTADSARDVVIPQDLADLIRQQGMVFDGDAQMLTKRLYAIQAEHGIPRFSVHKLRHFFASYMHQKGYTDKQIQEAGGWRTDNILKTVYQHAMEMDAAKKAMSSDIGDLRPE